MNKLRISIVFYIFHLLLGNIISQTYITPNFGRDYTYLEGNLYCSYSLEKGLNNNTYFGGVNINQTLNKNINISMNSNWTKKILHTKEVIKMMI